MIRKFDFAFNTPGLTTGVTVLNPTSGDILLDCWVEISTAFNGTTPIIDVGDYLSGNDGWFDQASQGIDATVVDTHPTNGPLLVNQPGTGVKSSLAGAATHGNPRRFLPGRFSSSNPVKLVCTQDGQKGGAATGATQGAGTVYFLTGTPA